MLSHIIKKTLEQIPYLFNKIVYKKKREHGREYNEKRERKYYDKYRTTMSRTESTNTMASIGLQRMRHHYAHYFLMSQYISIFKFYIIMHTVWQRRNVSKLIKFMMLSRNMSY